MNSPSRALLLSLAAAGVLALTGCNRSSDTGATGTGATGTGSTGTGSGSSGTTGSGTGSTGSTGSTRHRLRLRLDGQRRLRLHRIGFDGQRQHGLRFEQAAPAPAACLRVQAARPAARQAPPVRQAVPEPPSSDADPTSAHAGPGPAVAARVAPVVRVSLAAVFLVSGSLASAQPGSARHAADCVAALKGREAVLAVTLRNGAPVEPELFRVVRSGFAFVGRQYVAGLREREARQLLESAEREFQAMPPDVRKQRQAQCLQEGEQLYEEASLFERGIIANAAERRVRRVKSR